MDTLNEIRRYHAIWQRLPTTCKYAAIIISSLTLTFTPLTFRKALPNWIEFLGVSSSIGVCISGLGIAKQLGEEMERGAEVKQFQKVVRVKQLEAEATAQIREYRSLLGLEPPLQYDPNVHEIIEEPATQPQPIPIADKIKEQCGEPGLLLLRYCQEKGLKYAENGFIPVEKLRVNWAKAQGLRKEELLKLLSAMTAIGAGEFSDSSQSRWKPIAAGD